MRTNGIYWRPHNARSALTSLRKAADRLHRAGDHRAVFLDIYTVITAEVVNAVNAGTQTGLQEPAALSELTGRFAEEALLAVKASLEQRPIVCSPWRLAHDLAKEKMLSPGQNALLGINAHINYDLPLVVYEYLASEGRLHTRERLELYQQDYFRINKVLHQCISHCLDVLETKYGCPLTRTLVQIPLGRRLVSRAMMFTVLSWRKRVWDETVELLEAGPKERAVIVNRIDRRSGRIAQAIAGAQVMWRWLCRKPLPALWHTANGQQNIAFFAKSVPSVKHLVLTGRTRKGKELGPVLVQ